MYLVKRKSDGLLLASKEVDYRKLNEDERRQVVSEVSIISQIKHPNVVKYYDK